MGVFLKSFISIFFIFCIHTNVVGQKVEFEELEVLVGSGWKGTMNNFDFQKNEVVKIPAVLFIQPRGKRSLNLVYRYPEDSENLSQTPLSLKKGGSKIGLHKIVSKTRNKNGNLVIKTESEGKVEWQKVKYFYTYVIGKKYFSIKREIWFLIDDIRITANDFAFYRE